MASLRALAVPLLFLTFAIVAVSAAWADSLDDAARRVGKQLQCPVCSGASVADSPSDLAGQMRGVIRRKLEEGESEDQVIAYFVERYGDGILIEPPRRGVTLAVWIAPVAILVVGGIVLLSLLRRWVRPPWTATASVVVTADTGRRNGRHSSNSEPAPASSVERAQAELDRFRKGS